MAATPDGLGYWLVTSTGKVTPFGSARWHGDASAVHLSRPVVSMAATADGGGYWLAASDGGVFTFGDAVFHGSAGGLAWLCRCRRSAPTWQPAATGWPPATGVIIITTDEAISYFVAFKAYASI